MGVIYIVICFIFVILFFISKSYKKEYIKNIPSKENPLKKLYSLTNVHRR